MRSLLILIHARPVLALAILAIALCMKLLVPSGYMISAGPKTFTVSLCSGDMSAPKMMTISIPADPSAPVEPAHKGKTDGVCAFSALSMAAMGGADAPLLALALAFILALGFLSYAALPHGAVSRLLPPSRGPPARA